MGDPEATIRKASEDDLPQVLDLLQASLGWVPDGQFEAFFRWKHHENPAGRSPAWVAEHAGEVVAFRTFLRWRLLGPDPVSAVRAVDTATHPRWQGRGLFRALTEHGIAALADDGTQLVFNTPNDSSRPGYLKMGWQVVGRVPVRIRPARLRSIPRLRGARVPAERWGEGTGSGDPVDALVPALPAGLRHGPAAGLRTDRTASHLTWRYGFPALGYAALALDDDPARGAAIYRVRRRGTAREATICEVFADSARGAARIRRAVARRTGADVVVSATTGRAVPDLGPILTYRPLRDGPAIPAGAWRLTLGDVELL